ncbi:MAG: hypothetical protein IIA54_06215 [Chloroflexi bacterium]|nr:hypothetical protein [Chloroflexota bacterium]
MRNVPSRQPPMRKRTWIVNTIVLTTFAVIGLRALGEPQNDFHFALLGDRTGGAKPQIYGRVWREIAIELGEEYPDVALDHQLADSCAMLLIQKPTQYDVLVMANLFGDILSDEAAVLTASLGMLPSASLAGAPSAAGERRRKMRGFYEPIHGSAPDIAGSGKANPIAAILSAGFMLEYSLGLREEAAAVRTAVDTALADGHRTADLAPPGAEVSTTQHMTDVIIERL